MNVFLITIISIAIVFSVTIILLLSLMISAKTKMVPIPTPLPPKTYYQCQENQCIASDSGYSSKDECQQNCIPKPDDSVTMAIWSGGATDWQDLLGKVDYIFLASALPQEMTPDINQKYGGAFLHIDATPEVDFIPSVIGSQKLLLSIGGSAASMDGWKTMAQQSIDSWVTYFMELKKTFGIGGIDWDIEPDNLYSPGDDSDLVNTFFGDLSVSLKTADPTYHISVTVFGNAGKYTKGQATAALIENYIDFIDVIPIMIYNGGMWRKSTYGSWCGFADGFLNMFSEKVKQKTLYAVWIASQSKENADCCGSCIAEVLNRVKSGMGAGIAFWCYGGYNGACSNFKSANLTVIQQLQKTGLSTTEQELQNVLLHEPPYNTHPEYCLSNGCGN